MLAFILRTANDPVLTVSRLVLGGVMFAHAAQKVLGWFGGNGFTAALGFYDDVLGIPVGLAALAIATEFTASLALIAGFFSRVAALGIIGIMIGAIGFMIGANGFFMNWFGQMDAGREGYEYHLLAMTIALLVVIRGGGALSIDRLLAPA
jgi:putative oxidoreductase